jgi:hypothetical protein
MKTLTQLKNVLISFLLDLGAFGTGLLVILFLEPNYRGGVWWPYLIGLAVIVVLWGLGHALKSHINKK